MPPPSWIGIASPTTLIISRITFSFLGRPATAPFRSTTCSRRAPCSTQCFAVATGSSLNTVALAMSPCFRRTQRPSFKSIAGMMSTRVLLGTARGLGPPLHEVGEQAQAGGLAFFRVELHGKDVIACNRAGKGNAVLAGRHHHGGLRRRRVVAVHEIEALAA